MKFKRTFLVMAEYVSSIAVMGFAIEADAIEFCDACKKHARREPKFPESCEGTEYNEADYNRFLANFKRWQKRCPAGEDLSGHDYSVVPLKFKL